MEERPRKVGAEPKLARIPLEMIRVRPEAGAPLSTIVIPLANGVFCKVWARTAAWRGVLEIR
jgi:hypothetical protein